MTTIDYKEKYEQALERARQFSEKPYLEDSAGIVEYIFPELKESEDERIRKELISVFSNREKYLIDQSLGDITVSEALAWLKKQRPSGCPEYCVMSNCSNCPYHPIVVKQNPSDVSKQEDIELTEFEGALYTTFSDIWQDYMLGKEINVVDFVREHSDELLNIANKQKPTEWSDEDERLRKSCIAHIEDELERIRNDKYGHSEIISDLKESCRERIKWLKSIRPQNTWKPSEEQMDALQYVYRNLNPPLSDKLGGNSLKTLELMYQDLKKLK